MLPSLHIMPVIKRYPNRKLYDTEAKRYVTLEDVARMIQAGQEIQVLDHENGEDLTNLTLTQIILEQERKSATGFVPRSLLTSLIRSSGDTLDQVRRSLPSPLRSTPKSAGEDSEDIASSVGASLEAQTGHALDQGKHMVEQMQALLRVDERIAGILHLLNVPSQRDLQQLQARLEALDRKLEQVLEQKKTKNGQ